MMMIKTASIILILVGLLTIMSFLFLPYLNGQPLIVEIIYGCFYLGCGIVSFKKPFYGLLIGTVVFALSVIIQVVSIISMSIYAIDQPEGGKIMLSIVIPYIFRVLSLVMLIVGTMKAFRLISQQSTVHVPIDSHPQNNFDK